jgi:3-isopropylmalate/(R)-2-methylmalate dehydratase small subunit
VIPECRAVLIDRDDIDTDVLFPGRFLDLMDIHRMSAHLFEGLDPGLRDRLGGDTALVVGANFGCGSSREHVPQAMKASGIRFLVGRGFARIFYRNCVNLGLPVVVSADAVSATRSGSTLTLDLEGGVISVDDARYPISPVPSFMREILAAGGLEPWLRGRLDATTAVG